MDAWFNRFVGALSMYVLSGLIVTWSMVAHTTGNCPWWLPPYWTATWLYQVVLAALN